MPKSDLTVRVRIRLCIDDRGNYNALGWAGPDYTYSSDDGCIIDGMPTSKEVRLESWYTIEADVPIPESGTIQGEAKADA